MLRDIKMNIFEAALIITPHDTFIKDLRGHSPPELFGHKHLDVRKKKEVGEATALAQSFADVAMTFARFGRPVQ